MTKAGKKELRAIRRRIGMISQNFNLVKRSTVQKNVLSGRLGYYPTWKSILGIFSKEDYQLANDALERVGLLDKLHSRSDELSADSSSGCPSPEPWCSRRTSFWPMSRWRPWTPSPPRKSWGSEADQSDHGKNGDCEYSLRPAGKGIFQPDPGL